MSKEREFLKKLRYASLLENNLRKELEELLAQPETEQEPLSSIKILELTSKHEYAINLIRAVEKAHGIGGGE